jgi:phosphoglycerate dehydrogenase-like enzyme
MSECKSQLQSLEVQPEFSRRQLIYLSTLGVAGAGAIGTQILAPKSADAATVLGYVARFALSVGAAVVADYIGDYLKRRSRSSPKLTRCRPLITR